MNDALKLSICIPTYNQPDKLEATLASIIPQLVPGVEIVIRDDSPNDESARIVESYAKKAPIRYFHGEKIGIDAADFFVAEKAYGDYIWWFGNDEIAPGGVKKVLDIVTEYPEIDLIWVNGKSKEYGELGMNIGPSRFFKNGDEAVEILADQLAFLSAIVFRRDKWVPDLPIAKKYIGSCLAQLYFTFHILSGGGRYYYIAEPYVIAGTKHPEDQLFFDAFEVFGITYYKVLKEFEGKFSSRAIKKSLARNFNQVWRGILVYRANGLTTNFGSKSRKLPVMFKLYWSFPDFWKALPFLLMPRWMVGVCYRIYKKIQPKTWDRFREKYMDK